MRVISSVVFVLMLASAAFSQEALHRQISLAEMTASAGSIVRGRVLDAKPESHPDYPNVYTLKVTVQVLDAISGIPGQQLTFRTYLAHGRFGQRQLESATVRAGYRAGDEMVLFLYAPSQLGLTSLVGGEQGRFRVVRGGKVAQVSNGLGNRGLFQGVAISVRARGLKISAAQSAMMSTTSGPVELQSFVDLVRQLASAKGAQ